MYISLLSPLRDGVFASVDWFDRQKVVDQFSRIFFVRSRTWDNKLIRFFT